MSRRFEYRAGQQFGKWTLVGDGPLGASPGAEVWAARSDHDEGGALKVLRPRASWNRIRRFAEEIRFLRDNPDRAGIVGVRDAYLPDAPARRDSAWLVMDRCSLVRDALAERAGGIEDVVAAMATITETLADLASEGIHHRDVKPGNLFFRDDRWLVGDFGLVDYPDKPELTRPGDQMGPSHFMAPEMFEFTDDADAERADVYSAGKTLFCLMTQLPFPPPGPHRLGDLPYSMASYIPHDRMAQLDMLVSRATDYDPTRRPTMADFAAELRAWEGGPPAVQVGDLSAFAKEAAALLAPGRQAEVLRRGAVERAQAVLVRFHAEQMPILHDAFRAAFEDLPSGSNNTILEAVPASPGPVLWQEGAAITPSRLIPSAVYLWIGFGVQLGPELDDLWLVAGHVLQPTNGPRETLYSEIRHVALGSSAQDVAMAELTQGLIDNGAIAIEAFLNALR